MIKDKKELDKICEAFLDNTMELYDIPGVVIGLSIGDEYVFTGARGFKNYITREPLSDDDIFHCASVSKLFTSMGIMTLVEDGLLGLDDRLADILPELLIADKRWKDIRLYQMLTHTSGLGDVEDYHWESPSLDDEALETYAASDEVRETPMLWEAGKGGFSYSNLAYELLGLIISKQTGMTYEAYMEKRLLKPAGMNSSTFLTFERTGGSLELDVIDRTNMAMPHRKAEDRSIVLEKHYPYNRQHAPSSTLTSNAGDLLRWARANINKSIVSEETYDKIWKEYAVVPNNGEKMGLGWFMRQQEGCEFKGHEGTDDGFRASFWMCSSPETAIVVLSNMSKAPVKKLSKKLFEAVIHHV
ncbi:MAG: serine hydrolase domain-containing protein [Bacillota bacterium]|nr:serine hydrolase domain-containing protein [Bacillota bacterium]